MRFPPQGHDQQGPDLPRLVNAFGRLHGGNEARHLTAVEPAPSRRVDRLLGRGAARHRGEQLQLLSHLIGGARAFDVAVGSRILSDPVAVIGEIRRRVHQLG